MIKLFHSLPLSPNMSRMISPLPSTLAYHFCFALCSPSCLCIFPPSYSSYVPLLVRFSHCVKPVGRLFPLERGLGSVYPITEYDSYFSHPYPPSPSVGDSSLQTPRLVKSLWSHPYALGFLIYLLCQYVVMRKRPCRTRAASRLRTHTEALFGLWMLWMPYRNSSPSSRQPVEIKSTTRRLRS